MNCEVALPGVNPLVMLVNANADQVRHNIREPVVVIAFHPHDFNVPLGIRQLPDVAEKLPVILREPGEVEVGENIAQKNQPMEFIGFENAGCFARVTGLCTQVQVGEDQRVVHGQIHTSVVAMGCYRVIKPASKLVHR
jgi:hypothetical protein